MLYYLKALFFNVFVFENKQLSKENQSESVVFL